MPRATGASNVQVDAYIAKARPFAQPVLRHLREIVHEAAPGVRETIKWSRPFFELEGSAGTVILGNMSAFKEHCSFGLWGAEIAQQLRAEGVASQEGMGTFGKITSIETLPPRKQLVAYVKEAARKIAEGERTKSFTRPRPVRVVTAALVVPEPLAAALRKDKSLANKFEAMSPSCRKEYCDWIADAKKEETRERRIAQALQMIAEGKGRNWKYEKPAK